MIKDTGNIVVHIEPKNSHWVRFLLDDIFGEKNFRNEIVWKTGGHAKNKKQLGRMHDTILVYSKTSKFTFNPQYHPYDDEYLKKTKTDARGQYTTTAIHNSQPEVNPRLNLRYEWNGHNKQWYTTKEKMQKLHDENRLEYGKTGIPRVKRYVHELDGIPITDLWTDINNTQSGEKVDYATQKPLNLLDRIIKMYSNENDLVVDIFAGSGTTGISALGNNRKYLMTDINEKGKEIFEKRII
jgi:site-specific DNA-methyltransferase (adenine-specific)/adenine-specific DNA-methyltransferase